MQLETPRAELLEGLQYDSSTTCLAEIYAYEKSGAPSFLGRWFYST